ncbi:S8 family serine peptidase [Pseudomonas sp.]|uniref:S8 family serine peptidase n=1 Tax=Pseudomonas sp. TaxID=306 RepID=UPI0028AC0DFF|nr:S8 family serine peptidase [Pseudomonas sp.]
MKKELAISRASKFNGNIHLRLLGYFDLTYWSRDKDIKSIKYILYIDDIPSKTETQDKKLTTGCTFTGVAHTPGSQYQGSVTITFENGTTAEHKSKKISITDIEIPTTVRTPAVSARPTYFTPANFKANPDCNYTVEICFKKDGLARFNADRPLRSLGKKLGQVTLKKHRLQRFELYSIKETLSVAEMLAITTAMKRLDYVYSAVLTPTVDSYKAESSKYEAPLHTHTKKDENTPDFEGQQEYLDVISENNKFLGMNVREAWLLSQGSQATVRHLDFGVYENHEDLKGNITVATNGNVNKNHGTSSTGVIAAASNKRGVTGIAHDCNFIYYDQFLTIEPILDDVLPGDIISLDIQTAKEYPVIADWSWWSKIKLLVELGAIVFMAAGNGSSDLAKLIEEGEMDDFGDIGAFLVGGCLAFNGERELYSNFNHYGLLVNSWGSPRVVTTGGGDLYKPDETNNRNYTARFGGTSAALPLVTGVAALVQSYAIEKYNIALSAAELMSIIINTGYSEGVKEQIGHRPNAHAALIELDKILSQGQPSQD